ncbi:MAG: low-specificity L-threonine aldolase [Chloroflexi bacterium]|nr:low-specificity L-threonine aldolase [Chloroflexota bacterium]
MRAIDLRSDTVTLPSPEMRRFIFEAEVGDDVYGEDTTINALQAKAAELLGKEAALYVPSGTMGNLVAHLAWCRGGDEVICGQAHHTLMSEQANAARVAQTQLRTVPQKGVSLDLAAIEKAIRGDDPHFPRTGLIWVEQPCNGWIMPLDELAAISRLAHSHGIPVHMDGARIFNAAVALGVPASEIASHVDSVMFCVSKGLAAPVGSLIVGSEEFIGRAFRARKMLGGAMRQAGVIAAGGLFALNHTIDRLAEDHENARRLAAGLARLPGVAIDREDVTTNIFFIHLSPPAPSAKELSARLREKGVLCGAAKDGSPVIRLVTHYGIEREDVDRAIQAFAEVLGVQPAAAVAAARA